MFQTCACSGFRALAICMCNFQTCACRGFGAVAICKKGHGICKSAVATLSDYGTRKFLNFNKALGPKIVPANFQTCACRGFGAGAIN